MVIKSTISKTAEARRNSLRKFWPVEREVAGVKGTFNLEKPPRTRSDPAFGPGPVDRAVKKGLKKAIKKVGLSEEEED